MRKYSLIFLLCAQCAFGAVYYVDFEAGSDAAVGTSTGAAWKHCPDDANATGTAAATALAPGDVVNFKGGSTYVGQIDLSSHGVTYQAAPGWGTGKTIIDGNATYYHAFKATGITNIVISGFDMTNHKNNYSFVDAVVDRGGVTITNTYTGSGSITNLGVIRAYQNCHDWTITNCFIRELEHWADRSVLGAETDADPNTDADIPCQQELIYWYSGSTMQSGLRVVDCEFWGMGTASIKIHNAVDTVVERCNFGGSNPGAAKGFWSIAFRIEGTTSQVSILDCVFHDGWRYEGDESVQRSHAGDWIHIYGAPGPSYVFVERNFFYNDATFAYGNGTSNFIYPSDGVRHIYVRNNIAINGHPLRWIFLASQLNVVNDYIFIENNTLLDFSKSNTSSIMISIGTATGDNLFIRNNIFYHLDNNGLCIRDVRHRAVPPMTSDNNIFYFPANARPFYAENESGVGALYNFAGWQALTGGDFDSVSADPILTLVPANGSLSSSLNAALLPGSPAIDAGTDLSASFTEDYAGGIRPTGAWDIGALEYVSGSPDIVSPVVFGVVVVPGTTSASVLWSTDEAATSALDWGLTAGYGSTSSDATLRTSHSLVAANLAVGTTYFYRIRSVDAAGNAAVPVTGTFTTETPDVPDNTPPSISAVDVNPSVTSATVSWATDEPATSLLEWGLTVGYGSMIANATFGTTHALSATGLTGGTTYFYRVSGADAAGNIAPPTTGTFTTDASPPVGAGTIRVEALDAGQVTP